MQSLFKLIGAKYSAAKKVGGEELCYRVYANNKQKRGACVFVIGCELVKKMRWMAGDYLDVLFNIEEQTGQIIRTNGDGWKLTDSGGAKGGTSCTLRFGQYEEARMPQKTLKKPLKYEVTENTIFFQFPSGCE